MRATPMPAMAVVFKNEINFLEKENEKAPPPPPPPPRKKGGKKRKREQKVKHVG